MGSVVDWGSIGSAKSNLKRRNNPNGNLPKLEFLRLKKGQTIIIRLLGRPVHYYKYIINYAGKWRSAIVGDETDAQNDPIGEKYKLDATEKYAVNCFDRADGLMKIYEFAPTIYDAFCTWANNTGDMPGGPKGGDFKITATGKKGADYYEVKFVGRKPFTPAEATIIKQQGLFKLEQIFKALPPEEIEKSLYEGNPPSMDDVAKSQVVTSKKSVELNAEEKELIGEIPTAKNDVVGDKEDSITDDDLDVGGKEEKVAAGAKDDLDF